MVHPTLVCPHPVPHPQVSTWFANARRRLKKENKLTWTPRNRSEDEDEEDVDLGRHEDDDVTMKMRTDETETAGECVYV